MTTTRIHSERPFSSATRRVEPLSRSATSHGDGNTRRQLERDAERKFRTQLNEKGGVSKRDAVPDCLTVSGYAEGKVAPPAHAPATTVQRRPPMPGGALEASVAMSPTGGMCNSGLYPTIVPGIKHHKEAGSEPARELQVDITI